MKVVLSAPDDHTGVAEEEDIHNVPHLPPSYQPPFPQISSGESQVNELKTELKTSKRYSLSIDNRCKYSSKKSISSGSIKRKRILSCSEDSSNQANFIAITTPTFPSLSFLSPFNRHNYLLKSRDSRVIKSCQSPDPGSDYPSASPSLCDMSISSASYPATSPIITSFSSRVTAYLLRIIMIFVSITTKQDQSLHSKCVKHQTKALAFLLIISYSTMIVHGQPPPLPPAGFLDFDNLPVTRFSCEGKVIGGYYADVETGCQMFHVCTLGQKDEIQDIKFLCLNGTVFDQETRVCERVDEVDCAKAEEYFDLNLDLYVPHATTPKTEDLEEEDDNVRPVQSKAKSTSTTTPRTTTTTPTPSPRTRPPTTPSTPRSRGPPVISSSSQQSSSQQDDGEEDDDNNPYTSFNYYLKTPHSHVASGYNSQSRQSYLFNQPAASRSSGDTSSSVSSSSSSGRKVPAESGPKTVVYSSSSVSSSSTVRPKTVVIVKSTLPPTKSILKPKTLPTPIRTTTTTTTTPIPTKYELDDQYDDYYDDEDYTVEQQQNAPPSKGSVSYAQYPPPVSKTALISSERERYDFRDSRSSKGIGNAGLVTSTERGVKTSSQNIVTSSIPKHTTTTTSRNTPDIKVISSKFIETAASTSNSTEEPYYYEDDYPDDTSFQSNDQRQESKAQSISTSKSKAPPQTYSSASKTGKASPPGKTELSKETASGSGGETDYYDDDTGVNVNPHDHHFTHVDVPRIPFAKPNVPRVLVTNGKPFLPRLRRQSHHHLYYSGEGAQEDASLPVVPPASSPRGRSLAPSFHQFREEARMKAKEWGKDR